MHGLAHSRPHRALVVAVAAAGAVAAILYFHRASWWPTPLAVPALVLAHVIVLGGVGLVVGHRPGAHPEGNLLHRPRSFDRLVRVITLGRESRLRAWTLGLADLRPGGAVLDVGCGTGTLLLAAAERVGRSGTLRGVEPSPEMAAHARRKAEAAGVTVEIAEQPAANLPYPDASFDAVLCTLVLHHVAPDQREASIREMRRVLRPGGRMVLVDWRAPESPREALTSPLVLVYLLHRARPDRSPLDDPGLMPLLADLGFEDVARSAYGAVLGAVVARAP